MNASMILSFERDINDPLITFCPATLLARGDRNANIIKLTVMDGNAPADLSGNTAVVLFQRPGDSYVVRCPGSVSGNVISVTLLGDCYIYAGQYYASLILDADGFTRTMLRLAGQIESNGDGPIIDPTGTIPGYEDIARIYAELEASLERSDAATDSANAAAQNANEKAAIADTAAGNANTAAGNANAGAGRANEASESIEGLTVEASDVSYDQPATATVTDVDGHKHIAFGLRQGVPGAVPKLTFTGETGEPNTDVVITQSGPPEAPVVNLKIPQGVPGTGNVSTVDGVGSDAGGNVALSAVRYVAQTIEDAQKVQARKNIGVDGQVYSCTAQSLEEMSQEQQAEIYAQGYRAIKTENNGTVVLLGLWSDGSLEWLGCNQPRQNLLDNPNFAVAQAGYGRFHGLTLYAADRWLYNGEAGQVSFNDGLVIETQYTVYQRTQNALNDGKTRTVVVRTATSTGCLILGGGYVPVGATGYSATYDTGNAVYINKNTADAGALVSVELYEGNYTPKILPPWEKPDYSVEIIKCQYFYRRDWVSYQAAPPNAGIPGFSYPRPMRVPPTINIYNESGDAGYVGSWGQPKAFKVVSTPATNERLYYINTETVPQTVVSCVYFIESIADL
ncbi:hypothetical protein [Gemmiger formicilis]|uniref:hypothetical protein n=1 Tax=Gemmiger formicilis TaxID=745368 RepID=UPI003AB311B6